VETKYQSTEAILCEEFPHCNKTAKVIQLEKVQDNLEWLERSLTCISDIPRDVESLRAMIGTTLPVKILVRDLGKFKFLLTMESKEIKDKLKNEGAECLKQWFTSVSDWGEDDICQTRRIWLEIVGVQIHIWSEQNIRRMAEKWGDVVYVEKDTSNVTPQMLITLL